jgi:hypothetical protein
LAKKKTVQIVENWWKILKKLKSCVKMQQKLSPNLTPFFFFLLEIREFVTKFCRNSPLNFFFKKTQEPLHLSGALLGVN